MSDTSIVPLGKSLDARHTNYIRNLLFDNTAGLPDSTTPNSLKRVSDLLVFYSPVRSLVHTLLTDMQGKHSHRVDFGAGNNHNLSVLQAARSSGGVLGAANLDDANLTNAADLLVVRVESPTVAHFANTGAHFIQGHGLAIGRYYHTPIAGATLTEQSTLTASDPRQQVLYVLDADWVAVNIQQAVRASTAAPSNVIYVGPSTDIVNPSEYQLWIRTDANQVWFSNQGSWNGPL